MNRRGLTDLKYDTGPEARLSGALLWMVIACAVASIVPVDALVLTWPNAIAIAAEITTVAGFCGYMAAGVRPNAYYRRRLPTY